MLSAPAKDAPDLTCVLGVNDDKLTADMKYVSNASCTTNCLAPVAKVLHEIVRHRERPDDDRSCLHERPGRAGLSALRSVSGSGGGREHHSDVDRGRQGRGRSYSALKGKLTGISLRVPVTTGSVVDLTAVMSRDVTKEEVNAAMKKAADGPLKGILCYTEDPIVSSDIIGDPHSSIFAADFTQVLGGNLLKVVSWYDNEWGYSVRTADLIAKIGKFQLE